MNLVRIHESLRDLLGLDPESLGKASLRGAVRQRMRALGFTDPDDYALRLRTDAAEVDRLSTDVVVHETSFFRYPAAFELLTGEARARLEPGGDTVFRVSCVACSTGEEPASAVMALLDAGIAKDRFDVEALDVSPRAIAYAEAGLYRRRGMLRMPEETRTRWFEEQADGFLLKASVRECIGYRTASALAPAFAAAVGRYDAIFCRNLLIYLVPEAREQLLGTLVGMLKPGGLIFVGHAEVTAVRALGLLMAGPIEAFACRLAPVPVLPKTRIDSVPPRRAAGWEPASAPASPRSRTTPPTPRPTVTARATATGQAETLEHAERLANQGDLAGARSLIQKAVNGGHASAGHFHLLALVEGARSKDQASEAALRRALYLEPEHYPSLVQMALLAETRGDHQGASRLKAKAERVRAVWEAACAAESAKGAGRDD